MQEEDLLKLAARGRVKFFEPNEYVLAQGGSRFQVLVIHQGTVSLWAERCAEAKLLDVRGAGDMLGIDQFKELRSQPYAARSASDVLLYAFSSDDFEALVLKYPYAKQYVSAFGTLTGDGGSSREGRDAQNTFLRELIAGKEVAAIDSQISVRELGRYLLSTNRKAIALLDSEQRPQAILTPESLLAWLVDGGDIQDPVARLADRSPRTIAADASVTDGVLAIFSAPEDAIAITSDGTATGRIQGLVTSQDLDQAFGDRPTEILRQIRDAADAHSL